VIFADTLSNNGVPEKHGKDYATDYLVDLLANRTAAFLHSAFAASATDNILAMVGTPAGAHFLHFVPKFPLI